MEHTEQVRLIKGLMHFLDTGTNVDAGGQVRNPVSSYTCPDMARREWTTFFQDYPHVMGLSPDLNGPGAFMTSNDLGKPILMTRDQDGTFRAFLNVCSHRGTMVESERRGRRTVFSCPFHAWSYSTAGDLVSVPKEDHFGPVDRACHGLVELPATEACGILWVNPNPQGTLDVDALLQGLAPEFTHWDFSQSVHEGETRLDHAMNWKLAVDTFGETYHFNVLHRNTLAETIYGNVQMYDTFGRNHRMMLCQKQIETLREMPEASWNVLDATLPVYYIFPNVQLILGRAGPTLVRIYPDGENPHQSHSQVSFYLSPEAQALADRGQAHYEDIQQRIRGFAEVIDQEDYVAAASSHQGILSGALEHFTFGRNEPALHHYHNTYRQALGLDPLERISN